jgi:thiamine-phosphate diphosphorylase
MSTGLTRPLICLVTDRSRVTPPGQAALLRLISAAARAGVDLVQIREAGLEAGELLHLTRNAVAAVAGSAVKVVVNDRTDVALAAGAHGVHLRADSISSAQVRAVVPAGFLIGRSVHSEADAMSAAAAGADYLIAGTVFGTVSKPAGAPLLGLDGLGKISRAAGLPVLAIGGVAADKLEDLAAAGAAGIAAIGLFADVSIDGRDDRLDAMLRPLVARLRAPFVGGPISR